MSLLSKYTSSFAPRHLLNALKTRTSRARSNSITVEQSFCVVRPARRPVSYLSSALLNHSESTTTTTASIALQNNDHSNDAVVISTIASPPPFANHEELLCMTRGQLLDAARVLNGGLPAVLQIDLSEARSDTYIRNAIEVIIGLRRSDRSLEKSITRSDKDKARSHRRSLSANFVPPPPPALSPSLATSFDPAPRTPERARTRPPHGRSKSHGTLTFANTPGFGVGFYQPNAPPGARLEILEEATEDDASLSPTGAVQGMCVDVDHDVETPEHMRIQQRPVKKQRLLVRSPAVTLGDGMGMGMGMRPPSGEFKMDSPTPVSREFRGTGHKRMASYDEGRLRECQGLDPAGVARLFGTRTHVQRVRPKVLVGRTSTPKRDKENAVSMVESGIAAGTMGGKKRKASELDASDLTFGLDGLTIDGMEISISMSRSEDLLG